MNGSLPTLPTVLNPTLYASALSPNLNLNPSASSPLPTPSRLASSASNPPGSPLRQSSMASIQAQNTGYSAFRNTSAPVAAPAQIPWEITASEKADSDKFFDEVDTGRRGAIEGEAAVGFFSQSGLPIEQLAKVWDLADIRESGALNKEEFAVALKLIRDNLAGKPLPEVLPLGLTPPSLRRGGATTQAQAQAPAVSQPQRDLLDLMDDEPLAPLPSQGTGQQQYPTTLSPQGTGQYPTSSIFPQNTGNRAVAPQSTGTSNSGLQGTIFPQATGQSQNLTPQGTGLGSSTAPRAIVPPKSSGNFFDDNDDADQSAKLSADSVTLGNLQNEYNSTTAAVTKLAHTRSELESSLSSTTSAINELQVKLSQARAAHETERTMVEDLQRRHGEQAQLLARQRTELITAESDLSALRVERTEIEGNYLRDKEDVRDMKKKMAEIALENKILKEELEKKRKEARQQKGLVAISRKQLMTAEAEREKLHAQIGSVEKDVAAEPEEEEEESPFDFGQGTTTGHHVEAAVPLPVSPAPAMASPTSSIRSTNPFDRFSPISAVTSPMASPAISHIPTPSPPAHPPTSSSLPVAAAVAVGAGAVAAVTALGAGVAGVLGVTAEQRKEESGEDATTPVPASHEADPFGLPATSSGEAEQDPFGLPASGEVEKDPFGLPTSESKNAFDSTFDDGFGDDFSKAPVETIAPTATGSTDFEDAFSEVDNGTRERAEGDHAAASTVSAEGKGKGVARQAEEEPESSDDENEIEEAVPSGHGTRELSEGSRASPQVGTSTSDSGESFVHVSAPAAESEMDTKFPALETLAEPTIPAAAERSISPASELDTFEDAAADSGSPVSPTFGADSAVSGKKRPAPPPPARIVTSQPSASPTAFDDAFGDSFGSAPAGTTSKAPLDDFDDAFADLPPPVEAAHGLGTSSFTSANTRDADFDTFDDDFSFKPAFEAPTSTTHTPFVDSPSTLAHPSSAFDDSFASFDQAFEPTPSVHTRDGSGPGEQPPSFEDAFSSAPVTNLASSLGVPGLAPPVQSAAAVAPAPTPALDDDVDGIKQITAMGFSRSQAISALEKYNTRPRFLSLKPLVDSVGAECVFAPRQERKAKKVKSGQASTSSHTANAIPEQSSSSTWAPSQTRSPLLSFSDPIPSRLAQRYARAQSSVHEGGSSTRSESFSPSEEGDRDGGDSQDDGEQQPWSDAARGVAFLSLNASGSPIYVGPSSGFSWARVVMGGMAGAGSQNGSGASGKHFGSKVVNAAFHKPTQPRSAALRDDALASLPQELADMILSQCYRHLQVRAKNALIYLPYLTVLDLAASSSQPNAHKEVRTGAFFIWMLFAIGTRLIPRVNTPGLASPDAYYEKAMEHLEVIVGLHDLKNVQALMLVWFLVGIVVRLCISLGLHRRLRPSRMKSVSSYTLQLRKRVFWSCYILDRMMAMSLGRPTGIADRDIDIELPLNVDCVESNPTSALVTGVCTSMSSSIHLICLKRIESLIQKQVYRVDRPTTEQPNELLARIDEWEAAIPAEAASPTSGNLPCCSRDYFIMRGVESRLYLLRPLAVGPGADKQLVGLLARYAADACEVQKRLHQSPSHPPSLESLRAAFLAGLTLLHAARLDRNALTPSALQRAIRACSNTLFTYIQHFPEARHFHDAFEDLASRVLDFIASTPDDPSSPEGLNPLPLPIADTSEFSWTSLITDMPSMMSKSNFGLEDYSNDRTLPLPDVDFQDDYTSLLESLGIPMEHLMPQGDDEYGSGAGFEDSGYSFASHTAGDVPYEFSNLF
ncbi:hypothetical protein P7C70_g6347, partial [Phenoliferia sp. Uapishka_3]